MRRSIPYCVVFVAMFATSAAADVIVFDTAQLTTSGVFFCRAAPACVASGNTAVLGTGDEAVTLTFTGVDTLVSMSNHVVPVTLGWLSASSASETFPARRHPKIPIVRFNLTLTHTGPEPARVTKTLEFGPGGRPILPFMIGTTYASLRSGVDGYGDMVYSYDVPSVPMNGMAAITADAGVVPEPATLVLVGLGLAGAAARRKAGAVRRRFGG